LVRKMDQLRLPLQRQVNADRILARPFVLPGSDTQNRNTESGFVQNVTMHLVCSIKNVVLLNSTCQSVKRWIDDERNAMMIAQNFESRR